MALSRYVFASFIMLLVIGCGATAEDGADTEPRGPFAEVQPSATGNDGVGTQSQELHTNCGLNNGIVPHGWFQGQPALRLESSQTHVCALTQIGGGFRGWGELATVFVASDGFWYLNGTSGRSGGVSASAHCVERACFQRPEGDLLSGFFYNSRDQEDNRCNPFPSSVPTFLGDAATMITGIGGRMDGDSESASIFQSDGTHNSQLEVNECSGQVQAYAYSYFAGHRKQSAKFWGGGAFTADAFDGPAQLDLAPANEAFCYLTFMSGRFFSQTEDIFLGPAPNGRWRLIVRGLASPAFTKPRASARCYLYNQN